MRYGLLNKKSGVIENVIELEDEGAYTPPAGLTVSKIPTNAEMGDTYLKGKLIKKDEAVPMLPISPEAFRVALLRQGKIDLVADYIAGSTAKEELQIKWEFALSFSPTDPFVQGLFAYLSFDETAASVFWLAAQQENI